MVNQIYPPELQLNKAKITDTEVPFLDLHLSIANGFVFFFLKFMINAMTLILILQIFRFWNVTFLAVLLMVYTFRNLLGLLGLQSSCGLQRSKYMFNSQTSPAGPSVS